MKVIEPSYVIITKINHREIISQIEMAARTCYQSYDKIEKDSGRKLIKRLIESGHEAMLELAPNIMVKFICNIGFSRELVRHRICSFAESSTRYCNFSKEKFGKEITVIKPYWFKENDYKYTVWENGMKAAEENYMRLLSDGATPQEARGVLPLDLKTEINCMANVREYRHILSLRCAASAHPSMRQLMIPLLGDFYSKMPELFEDLYKKYCT